MACDEDLPDIGFAFECIFPEDAAVYRHCPHVHQRKSFPFGLFDDDAVDFLLPFRVFGQKDEACPVFPFFRDGYSLQKNEFVRDLEHDSRSVPSLVVSAFRPSVLHVFEYFQGRVHQFVGFVSVDVHEHAYSACIVFMARVVQAFSHSHIHSRVCQVSEEIPCQRGMESSTNTNLPHASFLPCRMSVKMHE